MSGIGAPRGVTRVVLHIDRLALHGIAPGERSALVSALRAALTQQLSSELTEPTALAALAGRPVYQPELAAGRASMAAAAPASATGTRLGRQIAKSLMR